jgi:hypothetical protein
VTAAPLLLGLGSLPPLPFLVLAVPKLAALPAALLKGSRG